MVRPAKYVEGFLREERQGCEPEGRERRWRPFSIPSKIKKPPPPMR